MENRVVSLLLLAPMLVEKGKIGLDESDSTVKNQGEDSTLNLLNTFIFQHADDGICPILLFMRYTQSTWYCWLLPCLEDSSLRVLS